MMEAEARARAMLALEQQQQVSGAMNRGKGVITFNPPPYQPEEPLGADYSKGYLDALGKSASQAWRATKGIAKDAYNFLQPFDAYAIGNQPSGPYDTIARTAPEQTARVTGTLAAGVAGAAPGATLGASGGAAVGAAFPPIVPFTTAGGAILGGAVGAGLGMLGFDVGTDVALDGAKLAEGAINGALNRSGFEAEQGAISNLSQQGSSIRPASEYAKDAVYNIGQGALTGLAGGAVAAPIFGAKGLASYPKRYAERRVLETLNKDAPNWYNAVNEAFPQQQGDGGLPVLNPPLPEIVPGLQDNRSLPEITDSDNLRIKQRAFVHDDPSLYGDKVERKKKRDTEHLRAMREALGDSEATAGTTQSWIRSAVGEDLAAEQAAFDAEFTAKQQAFETERAARQAARDTELTGRQTAYEAELAARQAAVEAELVSRQSGVDAAGDAVRMKTGALPPQIDNAVAGTGIRSTLQEGIDAQRGKVSQKYGEAGDAGIDPSPIALAAEEARATYFRDVGKQPSGELEVLIAGASRKPEPVMSNGKPLLDAYGQPVMREVPFTVKDATVLLRDATKVMDGGDRQSAAVAREIKNGIDEALDLAEVNGQLSPEQRTALREGRALRKEQGDIFEGKGNPNKAILDRNYSGSPALVDTAVPGEVFTPSNPRRPNGARENVQRFIEAIKASGADYATKMEPIYRYAANTFKYALKEDGTIDTKKARQWHDQYDEALKLLPELRQQFADPVTAQAFMNEQFGSLEHFKKTSAKDLAGFQKTGTKQLADFEKTSAKELGDFESAGTKDLTDFQKVGTKRLVRSKAEVESGALRFWLKADVEPKVAVKQMLEGDFAGMNVKQTVAYLQRKGAKDAIAGLGRAVMEHLQEMTYEAPGKPNALADARLPGAPVFEGNVRDALLISEWKKIRKAVDGTGLYSESQMKTFDAIFEDKNSQMSIDKARLTPGSDTNQNSVVTSLLRVASRAMLKGKYSTIQFAGSVLGRVIAQLPEGAFQKLLVEVTLDPRIARDLQNKATAKNLSRSARAILGDRWHEMTMDKTPDRALLAGAKTIAPYAPTLTQQEQKPTFLKQNAVTSTKSFPTPAELLKPPAPGELKNSTFTLPARDAYDSAGKKKVNFLGEDMDKESLQKLISQQSPETQARIATESAGNPFAVSPKGAQGLAQLMPSTAMEIAKQLGEEYLPLRADMSLEQQQKSIEQNIRFGDYYYKKQLKRFNDPKLAWAAYNAGPQRVANAITKAGSRKWDTVSRYLPQETRDYVPRILNAKQKVEMA
jgi:hypothetical protein